MSKIWKWAKYCNSELLNCHISLKNVLIFSVARPISCYMLVFILLRNKSLAVKRNWANKSQANHPIINSLSVKDRGCKNNIVLYLILWQYSVSYHIKNREIMNLPKFDDCCHLWVTFEKNPLLKNDLKKKSEKLLDWKKFFKLLTPKRNIPDPNSRSQHQLRAF